MKNNFIYPFLLGILLMALGSSAKAIVDVAVLKKDNDNIHKTFKLIYNELKEIKTDVKELIKKN